MSETFTTFYFIRHGETASNVEGKFRGRADIPLSDNGLIQAQELADELMNVPFDAIYSSPLSRAIKTVQPIALSRNLDVKIHQGFNNLDLGDWTDQSKATIREKYPELWQSWISAPERMRIPNAETINSVRTRSFEAAEELASIHKGGTVAVVSHRAVLKPLIAALLDLSEPYFWKLYLDTAGYSVFRRTSSGWTMMHYNLTHHLKKSVEEIF